MFGFIYVVVIAYNPKKIRKKAT